jgi:tRNA(Ile)-lysidine synthase TilS/MesJ
MCNQCGIHAVYELTNKRKFCKNCFCRYLEKKVLNTIKKYSLLENAKKILVLCKSAKGNAVFSILERISQKNGIRLSKIRNEAPAGKNEIIALEDSLDDTAILVMLAMMSKNADFAATKPKIKRAISRRAARCIKPLYFCLDKEILLYAKVKGIKQGMQAEEKDSLKLRVASFINEMEKKHPEIKNAVVNSALEINALKK